MTDYPDNRRSGYEPFTAASIQWLEQSGDEPFAQRCEQPLRDAIEALEDYEAAVMGIQGGGDRESQLTFTFMPLWFKRAQHLMREAQALLAARQ